MGGIGRLRHYVGGKLQALPETVSLAALPFGEEAYFSLGRDGMWRNPLHGALDEVRFSRGQVYTSEFEPPASFGGRERVALYGPGMIPWIW